MTESYGVTIVRTKVPDLSSFPPKGLEVSFVCCTFILLVPMNVPMNVLMNVPMNFPCLELCLAKLQLAFFLSSQQTAEKI
jgi:hypothetical protein